ncbi:hypothetical protein [Arthrobacter methylotrophus]|uniref:Uncharacterized protein n=1 Tax=Arthrobacter methylotrophus TaxID=121291 RepID=A0ABV5UNT4_9MICC
MSTITASRPAPATTSTILWAVSDGAFENHFLTSTPEAAVWLTDEAMRQFRRGQESSVAIHLHDPFLGVLWDASTDVRDVFRATGWPRLDETTLHLRSDVIALVRDILITDDTPHDAPFPGISDPHTYALVCR